MIQVRKNFEFELTSGDFAGGSNEYTLALYVWQGEQSAIPALASYSLTKDIPSFSVDGVFDRINLSNLINDFIEYDQGTTGDSFCVWVRYEVFIDGIINNSLTFQDIALYGYTDNGTLLLDGRDFQIYDSILKVDTGFGVGWFTVTFEDGFIVIALDENTTGSDRYANVEVIENAVVQTTIDISQIVTPEDTGQTINILTADNGFITADNNIITVDNG